MTERDDTVSGQPEVLRGPRPATHTLAAGILALMVGLAGAWLALRLAGEATIRTGPFSIRLSADVGRGETRIELPPFGTLSARTHAGPGRLTATLTGVNVQDLQDVLGDTGLDALVSTVQDDTVSAAKELQFRVLVVALAGGALAGIVVFRRRWRLALVSSASALVVVGAIQVLAASTYDPTAFREPSFTGSLRLAPRLIGPMRQAEEKIDAYRIGLSRVVDGASRAYALIADDPLGQGEDLRVLHISDTHLSVLGRDLARELADGFDVAFVLDTGDATSFGTEVESGTLSGFGIDRPYVFVAGNHDSSAVTEKVKRIPGAVVLDGDAKEIAGLTVYGFGHPFSDADQGQHDADPEAFAEAARVASEQVRREVTELPSTPDIVAVHDDRMAEPLAGLVPLVVAGHFHEQQARVVDGTLYLRIGTTGGAGFGTLQGDGSLPLSAEILHFRPGSAGMPPRLIAFDVVEQFPSTGALTVTRHVVEDDFGTPTPSPNPSPSPG